MRNRISPEVAPFINKCSKQYYQFSPQSIYIFNIITSTFHNSSCSKFKIAFQITCTCLSVSLFMYSLYLSHLSRVVRKPAFVYAKTKAQISCAVTAQLISALVFATWIVLSLFFLNPKFQAPSHLLWLYSLVRVGPGRKPRRPIFSQRGSF